MIKVKLLKTLTRSLNIYIVFIKQFFKSLIEYRTDFIIGMFSFVILQIGGLLFISVIFNNITALNGWDVNTLIFMYGIYLLPKGIDHLITDRLWMIDTVVRQGDFDRYLLRPINPLFQFIAEKIDYNAIGEIILGLCMIIYIWPNLNINPSFLDILVVLVYLVIGTFIFFGLKLFVCSIGFFTMSTAPIMSSIMEAGEYTKYPISIFPKFLQGIVKYIIPFAYIAYYPCAYILGFDRSLFHLLEATVVTSILVFLGYQMWLKGIKSYDSSGS